jgi:hypothetical protein
MTQTLLQVFEEIVKECRGECPDVLCTFQHFKKIGKPLTDGQQAFVRVLNFSAIREKSDELAECFTETPQHFDTPESKVFYVVEMVEHERGWGQRPDGWLVFHTEDWAAAYIKRMTADRVGPAPDEYTSYHPLGYKECTGSIAEKMKFTIPSGNTYSNSSPLLRK